MLTLPEGENDADQYGRILRYVDTTQGVDVGLSLVTAGLAVARYDSTDGYPAHPRETDYHAAQIATLTADGAVTTVACQAAADAAEQARIMAEQEAVEAPAPPPAVDEWWRQYTSCTKLKNNANGHPPVRSHATTRQKLPSTTGSPTGPETTETAKATDSPASRALVAERTVAGVPGFSNLFSAQR